MVLADNPEFFDIITADQAVKIIKQLTLLRHAVCLALEQPEKSWNNILEETAKHHCYEKLSPRTLKRTFQQFKNTNSNFLIPIALKLTAWEKAEEKKQIIFLRLTLI